MFYTSLYFPRVFYLIILVSFFTDVESCKPRSNRTVEVLKDFKPQILLVCLIFKESGLARALIDFCVLVLVYLR